MVKPTTLVPPMAMQSTTLHLLVLGLGLWVQTQAMLVSVQTELATLAVALEST